MGFIFGNNHTLSNVIVLPKSRVIHAGAYLPVFHTVFTLLSSTADGEFPGAVDDTW
jgi:hypothetical protein